MSQIETVETDGAPRPAGHYSQGVVHSGVVYVAGQLPFDPAGGPDQGLGTVAEQAERTLRNVEAILEAAGSSLSRVLQMTIYVSDISHWPAVNEAYGRVMGEHKPARAVVPVGELHYGAALEVQAIAAVGTA